MERRQAARTAAQCGAPISETTATPKGERVTPESRFPHGMRNTATAYASSARTDVVVYEDLPGLHLLAVRNLIATTNDESYHGSASELPPATSHGYAEWDFSSVSNLVMFQWFLDAADYWFNCSDDSSAESYDPARECFMVAIGDLVDSTGATGLATGRPTEFGNERAPEPGDKRPSHLAGEGRRHQCAAGSSARARV
jgi:hypothetical protein